MAQGLKILMAVMIAALLAACSNGSQEAKEQTQTKKTESRVPEDNVFSGQVKSLENAEQVQQTIMDSAKRQQEEIDKQAQ